MTFLFTLFGWANEGDTTIKIPVDALYGIVVFDLLLIHRVIIKFCRF